MIAFLRALFQPHHALRRVREEFAYACLQDYPLHGADALHIMSNNGLCTQGEADAAILAAHERIAREERASAPEYEPPAVVPDDIRWPDTGDLLGEEF
ncbi:MAG TPA: hypothetical protein VKR31_10270 [Rhizomicrobium sp.]|nr:hypothetical protein [Rhizomicrobium sp.]